MPRCCGGSIVLHSCRSLVLTQDETAPTETPPGVMIFTYLPLDQVGVRHVYRLDLNFVLNCSIVNDAGLHKAFLLRWDETQQPRMITIAKIPRSVPNTPCGTNRNFSLQYDGQAVSLFCLFFYTPNMMDEAFCYVRDIMFSVLTLL